MKLSNVLKLVETPQTPEDKVETARTQVRASKHKLKSAITRKNMIEIKAAKMADKNRDVFVFGWLSAKSNPVIKAFIDDHTIVSFNVSLFNDTSVYIAPGHPNVEKMVRNLDSQYNSLTSTIESLPEIIRKQDKKYLALTRKTSKSPGGTIDHEDVPRKVEFESTIGNPDFVYNPFQYGENDRYAGPIEQYSWKTNQMLDSYIKLRKLLDEYGLTLDTIYASSEYSYRRQKNVHNFMAVSDDGKVMWVKTGAGKTESRVYIRGYVGGASALSGLLYLQHDYRSALGRYFKHVND